MGSQDQPATFVDSLTLSMYGIAGYRVDATINSKAARAKVTEDQLIAMALSVVPLGPPNDRTQWTNTPLR